MKRLLVAAFCLSGASAMAQNLNLKGRVLDKVDMKGVPGATVKVVGSSAMVTTDSEGRFTLTGALDVAGRFTRALSEPFFQGGALYVEASGADRTARVEVFGASGNSLAAAVHPLKAGWNRIEALPALSGSGRDFLGFARISVGGETWVKRMLHTAGPVAGAWFGGAAPSATLALAKEARAAAGQIEVSAPRLVKKTVNYTTDAADLGDIVLDYPERKLGVGAQPIHGAVVLFDGSKGKAAAAAELQAKWKDWPRFTTPSDIKFRIVRDPEFPGDTANHAALQSCCNTLWGYDDIQAKEGIFADFQVHVEFIGMGEYDNPFDSPTPNANANDATGSGQAGYINSGVYVASRYEVQIQSWSTDASKIPGNHDMGAIVNDYTPLSNQNKPNGTWQSYDITYRGARFNGSTMTSNPYMSVWWNGVQVHNNRKVNAAASGLSNHSGEEHNDTATYGLKLQSEGRDVRYRNIWIKKLNITDTQTNFGY